MTTMTVLLALALGLLAVIALELRAILAQLRSRGDVMRREREGRDAPAAGQTINVNLAPLPGAMPGTAQVVVPLPGAAIAPIAPAAGEPASEEESDEALRERERELELAREREAAQSRGARANSTPSGLVAVKCPACGAENSAYRHECFNCGGAL